MKRFMQNIFVCESHFNNGLQRTYASEKDIYEACHTLRITYPDVKQISQEEYYRVIAPIVSKIFYDCMENHTKFEDIVKEIFFAIYEYSKTLPIGIEVGIGRCLADYLARYINDNTYYETLNENKDEKEDEKKEEIV